MKTIKITILSLIVIAGTIFSQYKVEWSADHSSAGNFSIDKAMFIIADKDDNVFVTGVTNGSGVNDDITTIKYDKNGKPIWTSVYNGPGNYHDRPAGIAVDASGNVFVTGGSTGDNGTATDFITLKYNPSGAEMWAARYASKGGLLDESRSIAVDQNGNVYVTGVGAHYVTDNSGQDWITIKYNTNGEQIWLIGYDDGITSDGAKALTIDDAGNVYVTGQCNSPAYHIATIKYDPDGNKQWIAKYDGSAVSVDEPADIEVDNKGNVYITGYSSESNKDFITIMYDKNGNEIWKHNYNGVSNTGDEAIELLLDSKGNVYVLGSSGAKLRKQKRCLIKYNSAGKIEWDLTSSQNISHYIDKLSMAMNSDENILVTGSTKILSERHVTSMVIECVDKNGNIIWDTHFAGPDNSICVVSDIFVDNKQNIYATGFIIGNNSIYDYCTVKFSK